MAPALSIIRARSANGTFLYFENVSAALCSFSSICESVSGSKDFTSCPVAGLTVAIAISVLPQRTSCYCIKELTQNFAFGPTTIPQHGIGAYFATDF